MTRGVAGLVNFFCARGNCQAAVRRAHTTVLRTVPHSAFAPWGRRGRLSSPAHQRGGGGTMRSMVVGALAQGWTLCSSFFLRARPVGASPPRSDTRAPWPISPFPNGTERVPDRTGRRRSTGCGAPPGADSRRRKFSFARKAMRARCRRRPIRPQGCPERARRRPRRSAATSSAEARRPRSVEESHGETRPRLRL